MISKPIANMEKYNVTIHKIYSNFKNYDKAQYIINSNRYLYLDEIMDVCKEFCDEYGYVVYNNITGDFQDYYYRMEGRGLLFIEIENKKEWFEE